MPENFNWECQHVKREKNKGRAMGEIITGVKRNIREENKEGHTKDDHLGG